MSSRPKRSKVIPPNKLEQYLEELGSDFSDDDEPDEFRDDFNDDDPDWQGNGSGLESDDEIVSEEELAEVLQQEQYEDEEELHKQENEAVNEEGGECNVWSEFSGRQKKFDFCGKSGIQEHDFPDTPRAAWEALVTDDVIELIVRETNNYALKAPVRPLRKSARMLFWTPTNKEEIRMFLGLSMWMGLVNIGRVQDYWNKKEIYKQTIPAKIMSRNRYLALMSNIHFSDNDADLPRDRQRKIKPLLELLLQRFQSVYTPSEDVVIDETLVPWRGRLIFRQYLPNKSHKYGIKLFKLCDSSSYTWNIQVYAGASETSIPEVGLSGHVCLQLLGKLLNEGRTLYIDNFYTSMKLAKSLLEKKTHMVGTVRVNRKGMPPDVFKPKLTRGSMLAKESQDGIVVLRWRDTRDVRMISTKHPPIMVPVSAKVNKKRQSSQEGPIAPNSAEIFLDEAVSGPSTPFNLRQVVGESPSYDQITPSGSLTELGNIGTPQQSGSKGKKGRKKRALEKPAAIIDYNKHKVGIDVSDQMIHYGGPLRKGIKWYRKLGLYFLTGTAVVNSWVLYKKRTGSKCQIRSFRENLVSSLLNLRETPNIKQKLQTHHLDKRMNANNGKTIRRQCKQCYDSLRQEVGRTEAKKKTKFVTTYCKNCEGTPQLCLPCFNKLH